MGRFDVDRIVRSILEELEKIPKDRLLKLNGSFEADDGGHVYTDVPLPCRESFGGSQTQVEREMLASYQNERSSSSVNKDSGLYGNSTFSGSVEFDSGKSLGLDGQMTQKEEKDIYTGLSVQDDGTFSGFYEKDKDKNVYKDSPLILTADRMKSFTPPEYRQMRNLDTGTASFFSGVKLFYKQAKFMENFEDDYCGDVQCSMLYPTYNSMTVSQLRAYFSWRTKIRRGETVKAPEPFVFLYIYELINLIGVSSPQSGYEALKKFIGAYSEIDSFDFSTVNIWLRDFAVYYGVTVSPEDMLFTESEAALAAVYSCDDGAALFESLCLLSGYKLKNSPFYKKYPDDTARVVCRVFQRLREEGGYLDYLFGKAQSTGYAMFNKAVFYEKEKHGDCVREISSVHCFKCIHGFWFEEFRFGAGSGRKKPKFKNLSLLLKEIDRVMRVKYSFKPCPERGEFPEHVRKVIGEVVDELFIEKKSERLARVEIDFSKLSSIREKAFETQMKLTVEEGGAESSGFNVPDSGKGIDKTDKTVYEKDIKAGLERDFHITDCGGKYESADTEFFPGGGADDNIFEPGGASVGIAEKDGTDGEINVCIKNIKNILNEYEIKYLSLLLTDGDGREFLRSRGMLESVTADAVNEKLFDFFKDSVIVCESKYEIAEDYRGDLCRVIFDKSQK